jgi:hypothetical protein
MDRRGDGPTLSTLSSIEGVFAGPTLTGEDKNLLRRTGEDNTGVWDLGVMVAVEWRQYKE